MTSQCRPSTSACRHKWSTCLRISKRIWSHPHFIAHDLAVVKNISDRIAVMYLGKICEVSGSEDLYRNPAHPYTDVLLSSIPVPDPTVAVKKISVEGEPPSPVSPQLDVALIRVAPTLLNVAVAKNLRCAKLSLATLWPVTIRSSAARHQ